MAVYTHITAAQLSDFLKGYDLGTLVSFEGIAQGVSNTNYHVFTDQGRFILTLFEERRVKAEDLPFFFAFSDHLSQRGIQTPVLFLIKTGGASGCWRNGRRRF
jgi:homoserine kinase type II